MKFNVFLFFLVSVLPINGNAQSESKLLDKNGRILLNDYSDDSVKVKLTQAQKHLRKTVGLGVAEDYQLLKSEIDSRNNKHLKYQQIFKGIKVEGGEFIVHSKEDNIQSINGRYNAVSVIDVKPKISEKKALLAALGLLNSKKYKWEDLASERYIRKDRRDSTATYYPNGELLISQSYNNASYQLMWKFLISSLDPHNEYNIYVNANTGKVEKAEPTICYFNAVGSAQTRYSGTKTITADYSNLTYKLRELRNGVSMETLNTQSGNNFLVAIDFLDSDNNWTAAEYNNITFDQVALDAHWGAEKVLDYWKTVHNRNSIDGNGLRIKSFVHFDFFDDGPIGDNNAAWFPTEKNIAYGDGFFFSPLTSLDVCAHEFGHGVNQSESNLGNSGEPGAINESLSDIWAAVIEEWAAPEKENWLIGEDFGGPIRSMSNPNMFGHPDTYGGTNWVNTSGCSPNISNDFCGIHTNGGVLNYWFYLISVGGFGTNDLGNCYSVLSIGISDAAKIVYHAESNYLVSSSNFSDTRTAMIQASKDLFGNSSIQTAAVTNAWYAVGVGAAYQGNSSNIVGANTICFQGDFVNLNTGLSSGVTWSVSPASYFEQSIGSGNSAFLKPKFITTSGKATITFNTSSSCSGTSTPITKDIWIGKPLNNFSGATIVYPEQIYSYRPTDLYTDSFQWTVYPYDGTCQQSGYLGNCLFGGGLYTNLITIWWEVDGYIELNSSNVCGTGTVRRKIIDVQGPGDGGSCNPCQISGVFPNPSNSVLNISLYGASSFMNGKLTINSSILLINQMQEIVYSSTTENSEISIPTINLPAGIYILKVTNSLASETKQVLINH